MLEDAWRNGKDEGADEFKGRVAKVTCDLSNLHRLVERVKMFEFDILTSSSTSTSPTTDESNDNDDGYDGIDTFEDLDDIYKVLESLIQDVIRNEEDSMQERNEEVTNEVEEMTRQSKEKLFCVSAKLEQIYKIIPIKEQQIQTHRRGNDSSSKGISISTSPGGCGDVIGGVPLRFAHLSGLPGGKLLIQTNEVCRQSSFFSERSFNYDPSEFGDPRRTDDIDSKSDIRKFLQVINSSGLMDLKKYVLDRKKGRIKRPQSTYESETYPENFPRKMLSTENIASSQLKVSTTKSSPPSSAAMVSSSSSSQPDSYYLRPIYIASSHRETLNFNPSEVTLDTLVPCPTSDEDIALWPSSEKNCYHGNSQKSLETSFPVTPDVGPLVASCYLKTEEDLKKVDVDGRRDLHGRPNCASSPTRENLIGSSNYRDSNIPTTTNFFDPTVYEINSQFHGSSNIIKVPLTVVSSSPATATSSKLNKRTHSFNISSLSTSSYLSSPAKQLRTTVINPRRPKSSILESFPPLPETQTTPFSHFLPPVADVTDTNNSSSFVSPRYTKDITFDFRRAKSELAVERNGCVVERNYEFLSNIKQSPSSSKQKRLYALQNDAADESEVFDSAANQGCAGRLEIEGCKPKRKFRNVEDLNDRRPCSGCVISAYEFENSNFYDHHEIPYIDQQPEIKPLEDPSQSNDHLYCIPYSEETLPSTSAAKDANVAPTTPGYFSAFINKTSSSQDVRLPNYRGQASPIKNIAYARSPELIWPSTSGTEAGRSSGNVTYRKNSMKLSSRWNGFRRAFSMVFERSNNSNNSNSSNNNNNKNSNFNVKKASSTNFLDERSSLSEVKEERKRSRSHWDVWKQQSRVNIPESFRRKYSWLRLTLKGNKRKNKENLHCNNERNATQVGNELSNTDEGGRSTDDDEEEKEQVVIKTTLASLSDELLATESDYIAAMKYVIDNYLPLLDYSNGDLPEALRGKKYVIFGNLEKLHDFHSKRFQESLLLCKGHSYALGSAFLRNESEFYLYALYSKNKPKSDALMNECGRQFFQNKQMELRNPMNLESYLLKPIQRLSKYALMLKKILQSCPLERVEFAELEAAFEMVRFHLRHGEDLLAADCITACDVNLQEQGMLIRREDIVITKGMRKCSRHVFLFEDLILFAKVKKIPGGHDTYVYKHSLKTTDIGLTNSVGDDGRQFEIWFRKRTPSTSYRLQAQTKDSKIKWTSDLASLLWRQTQSCRQRANATIVMATGLGGNVGSPHDFNMSRPVSYTSSSSSSSSSNNSSIDHRMASLSSSNRNALSSSSSSSTQPPTTDASPPPIHSSPPQNFCTPSRARPLSFPSTTDRPPRSDLVDPSSPPHPSSIKFSTSSTPTSSSIRPPTFSAVVRTPTKLNYVQSSQSYLASGFPKLSPVKEQVT